MFNVEKTVFLELEAAIRKNGIDVCLSANGIVFREADPPSKDGTGAALPPDSLR